MCDIFSEKRNIFLKPRKIMLPDRVVDFFRCNLNLNAALFYLAISEEI